MDSNFREMDEFFDVGALRVMYMLHHPGGLSISMDITDSHKNRYLPMIISHSSRG